MNSNIISKQFHFELILNLDDWESADYYMKLTLSPTGGGLGGPPPPSGIAYFL